MNFKKCNSPRKNYFGLKKCSFALTAITLAAAIFSSAIVSAEPEKTEPKPLEPIGWSEWKIGYVSDPYQMYGSFNYCTSGRGNIGYSLSCSKSLAWSDSYNGTLKIPIPKIEPNIGITISRTATSTTNYTAVYKYDNQVLQIDVRDKYTVKNFNQEYWVYNASNGFQGRLTEEVMATGKQWIGWDYRVVELN
ncbi:hypothetical protein ACJ7K1_00130 [Paenibacillus elgii]